VGKEVEEKNFTATLTVRSAWGAVVSLYAPTERLLKKFLLAGELVRIGCGPYSHVAENSSEQPYFLYIRTCTPVARDALGIRPRISRKESFLSLVDKMARAQMRGDRPYR
jgi:hypothetical protein